MGLRDKLSTPEPAIPVPGITAPKAPRPEIMPPAPSPRVVRGRKRRQYTKAHHALDNVKAIDLWASERLVGAPGNACYVGAAQTVTSIISRSGRRQRVVTEYPLPTLMNDFRQFCALRNWALPPLQSFSGLILKHCVERGIPARADRSHRERRKIILGVALVGTHRFWDGNEHTL